LRLPVPGRIDDVSLTSTRLPAASESAPRRWRAGAGSAFWIVAFAFAVSMAFTTVPTPLYVLYQRRDGFSSFVVTVIYAAYAVGVIASLFLAGHVSDWLGRRRVLIPAGLLGAVSAVIFLIWRSEAGLLVARFVSGVAVGALTATATAQLAELHQKARPGAGRGRADLVATAANIGGLGLGAFVSGVFAQFVESPLTVPYVVFLVLIVVAAAALLAVPETVDTPEHLPRYRPQRISVESRHVGRYAAITAAGFASFAVFGLFTSLAPTFIGGTLGHPARILAGTVVLLVFGAAALVQSLLAAVSPGRQVTIGLVTMAVSLPLIAVSVWFPDLALFLVGGTIAGAGAGVLFRGSLSTVAGMADPQHRGEALAGLFLMAYAGLTVPVIGLGIAVQHFQQRTSLLGFAAVILVVIAGVGAALVRLDRRGGAPPDLAHER
jgi:MFS family permease